MFIEIEMCKINLGEILINYNEAVVRVEKLKIEARIFYSSSSTGVSVEYQSLVQYSESDNENTSALTRGYEQQRFAQRLCAKFPSQK